MDSNEYQKLVERTRNCSYPSVIMDSDEYQKQVERTRSYLINKDEEVKEYCLGMMSEIGELAGHFKHVLYHDWKLDRKNVKEEIGDALWYIAALTSIMGFTLDEIMKFNIEKLKERYPDGFSSEKSINRKEHKKGE